MREPYEGNAGEYESQLGVHLFRQLEGYDGATGASNVKANAFFLLNASLSNLVRRLSPYLVPEVFETFWFLRHQLVLPYIYKHLTLLSNPSGVRNNLTMY